MKSNYQFFVDYFLNNFTDISNKKVLDFGCGNGNVIISMREKGFEFYGVDSYYDGDEETYNKHKSNLPFIRKYLPPQEKIPFPDEYFDFIYSNQVFEHIKDINFILDELNRILKKDGVMVHNFPVKEYLVEGHFRLPFVHWFQKFHRLRKPITLFFLYLGFGINRNKRDRKLFANNIWKYIDEKCFYRTESEITAIFENLFLVRRLDKEKLIYHLRNKKILNKFIGFFIKIAPDKLIQKIEKRRGSITIRITKNNILL